MAEILLLNGPNLNLLGEREPEIYGKTTLQEIEDGLRSMVEEAGHHFLSFQSNNEGAMIDWLQKNRAADFLLINAGALTHTSVALRDSLSSLNLPFLEIHISNVYRRESFRHKSFLSDLAQGLIVGLGVMGYDLALQYALEYLEHGREG